MKERPKVLSVIVILVSIILIFINRSALYSLFQSSEKDSLQATKSLQGDGRNSHSATKTNRSLSRTQHIRLSPNPDIVPSPNFPEYQTHKPEELLNFYLPAMKLEQASLRDAVLAILQSYADICKHTKQEPLAFDVTFPENNGTLIDLELANMSFNEALLRIAHSFGTVSNQIETSLSFKRLSELPTEFTKPAILRSYALPSTFQKSLQDLSTQEGTINEQEDNSLSTKLREFGFLSEESSVAKLMSTEFQSDETLPGDLPASTLKKLVISEDSSDLDRFDGLMEVIEQKSSAQVSSDARIVTSPTRLPQLTELPIDSDLSQIVGLPTENVQMRDFSSLNARLGGSEKTNTSQLDGDQFTILGLDSHTEGYGFGISQTANYRVLTQEGDQPLPDQALPFVEHPFEDVSPSGFPFVSEQQLPDGTYQYLISATTRTSNQPAVASFNGVPETTTP